MLAVVSTLALLGLAGALLRRSTGRIEDASATVAELDPGSWTVRAAELRSATEVLRDAVDDRQRR